MKTPTFPKRLFRRASAGLYSAACLATVLLVSPLLIQSAFAADAAAQTADKRLKTAEALQKELQKITARATKPFVFFGNGSGIVLSPDGYILTNYHVVRGRRKLYVRVYGTQHYYRAELVGADPTGDLALLKIPGASGLPHAELGDISNLRVGQTVFAIGDPFSLAGVEGAPTITEGVIGALHRFQNSYTDAIQTDAAVNPGNSGGPLFSLDGRVIGINGQIASRFHTRANTGIGYAIPADQIKRFLPLLKRAAGGVVHHARPPAGLRLERLSSEAEETSTQRAVVREVEAESAAKKAGFHAGDVILAVDGKPVYNAARLLGIVRSYPGNAELNVLIRRRGKTLSLAVLFPPQPMPTGITYGLPRRELQGLPVRAIKAGSAAEKAGLKKGDVVRKIDGHSLIKERLAAFRALETKRPGDFMELEVLRHKKNPKGDKPLIETVRLQLK